MKDPVARQEKRTNAIAYTPLTSLSYHFTRSTIRFYRNKTETIHLSVGICIIAHEPLATAFRSAAQHIFSATGDNLCDNIVCYDVPADVTASEGQAHVERLVKSFPENSDILIFTDIVGATPSNISHLYLNKANVRVMTGMSLPALVTALSNINEPINRICTLAEGAAHGGISVDMGKPTINL